MTLQGDEHRLHQLVANLLANARTHTAPGTHGTVRLTLRGGDAVLQVEGDGPGVSPDARAEIFQRLVRADHGRSRSAGGTGLGLAIVRAVAAAHGGCAELADSPAGMSFIVILPTAGRPPEIG
ncbi:sensor histidine kinase [Actinomadura fibrosa]|uniref:histidine kinase n=1 Tax=Actinomadura fibrosa TaxID=111802 RepID=A0ABW2XQM6_9ACTN|nr:ATP-binding protein [Actinomadura fibrosa]